MYKTLQKKKKRSKPTKDSKTFHKIVKQTRKEIKAQLLMSDKGRNFESPTTRIKLEKKRKKEKFKGVDDFFQINESFESESTCKPKP